MTVLAIVSRDSDASRVTLARRTRGTIAVALELAGVSAQTEVDGSYGDTRGWRRTDPDVVVGAVEAGLPDLLEDLADASPTRTDEERWQSADGRLELALSGSPAGVVCSVVLKQYAPDGWVTYGKLVVDRATLRDLAAAAREFYSIDPARAGH